jgi:hypothetical protein
MVRTTVTVQLTGIDQLKKFAADVDEAVKKIHGRRISITVETSHHQRGVISQVLKPASLSQMMTAFSERVVRAHHQHIGLRGGVDRPGPLVRNEVQKFVGEQLRRPKGRFGGFAGLTLREQAIIAVNEQVKILPNNQALRMWLKAIRTG